MNLKKKSKFIIPLLAFAFFILLSSKFIFAQEPTLIQWSRYIQFNQTTYNGIIKFSNDVYFEGFSFSHSSLNFSEAKTALSFSPLTFGIQIATNVNITITHAESEELDFLVSGSSGTRTIKVYNTVKPSQVIGASYSYSEDELVLTVLLESDKVIKILWKPYFLSEEIILLALGLLGLVFLMFAPYYTVKKLKEGEIINAISYGAILLIFGLGLVIVWLWG